MQWHTKLNWLIKKIFYHSYKLGAKKSGIKDLFNDFLDETKNFKYQITVKILFKKTTKALKLSFFQFTVIQQQNLW